MTDPIDELNEAIEKAKGKGLIVGGSRRTWKKFFDARAGRPGANFISIKRLRQQKYAKTPKERRHWARLNRASQYIAGRRFTVVRGGDLASGARSGKYK